MQTGDKQSASNTASYASKTDEEAVWLAQQGDVGATEYLLDKYKSLVKARARAYFLIGADREDIIQEGMIGLYKAIRDFKEDKQANFFSVCGPLRDTTDCNGD